MLASSYGAQKLNSRYLICIMFVDSARFLRASILAVEKNPHAGGASLADLAGFCHHFGQQSADFFTGMAAELTFAIESTRGRPVTNVAEYFTNMAIERAICGAPPCQLIELTAAEIAPNGHWFANSAPFVAGCGAARDTIVQLLRQNPAAGDRQMRLRLYKMFNCAVILAREKTITGLPGAAASRI